MPANKEIVTVLKLDGKDFDKKFSGATKSLLGFSAAASGVLVSMAGIAKVAANFQDNMIKSARIAGTTAENFSALGLAAEQSGLEIDQFRDSLSKFQEAGPQKALNEIGIATKDVNGEARDSVKIFKDFADHINKIENPAQKTAEAVKVFGGEGARMINILDQGSEGLEKLEEKARNFGLVVSTEAGQAAERFNDNLNDISQATKGLTNTIGESLIAFVNQSSVLDNIEGTITSVTSWWRNLDGETKEFIITTTSLASGIGVAIGALTAITIAAKAFFAVIAANPVIIAITAIITAVVLLSNEIRKNFDQMQNIVEPLTDTFRDIKYQLSEVYDDIVNIADDIGDFGKGAKESGEEISILGTIAKSVFAVISTGLIVIITAFGNFINIIKLVGQTAANLGDIIAGALTFDGDKIKAAWRSLKNDISDNINTIIERSKKSRQRIGEIWADPIVYKTNTDEIDETNNKLDELKDKTKAAGEEEGKASKKREKAWKKSIGDVQGYIGVVKTAVSAISSISDSIAQGISSAADEAITQMQVVNAKAEKLYDKNKEKAEANQEEELESINNSYDAQIQALKDSEEKKQRVIENSILQRQLALDEEFQTEKERMEAEFETYVENERAKFEAKKEILDEETADNEQRKLVDQIMEADYDIWLESEKTRLEENLTDLAKTFGDKRTEEDRKGKVKQEKQAKKTNNKIEKLEKKKDDAITKTTEKFLIDMAKMDETEERRASKARKDQARAEWNRDLQVYQQTKATKIAEAVTTGASSAAQAVAQSIAALAPSPVGAYIGAAIAATIVAATAMRIGTINNSKPRKPAELRMQSGGVLVGPTHAAGGINNIEAQGGEGYLDTERTKKFLNIADMMAGQFDNKSGGKVINVNFSERAIIVNDINAVVPEVVDIISRELASEVRRKVAV